MTSVNWHYYFKYDETSPTCLRWDVTLINSNGRRNGRASKGKVAGISTKKGAITVRLYGKAYIVSRVIWEMNNGVLSRELVIDHKDGCKHNNRLNNLRVVTQTVNKRNQKRHSRNVSNFNGVSLHKVTRGGVDYTYWRAIWADLNHRQRSKIYSVLKYGNDMAFHMACEHRIKMIQELNNQGAGYTDRHGK